jgi:single-strand DNA-binding protein
MGASVNRATILGHLGADPEIRNLPEGGRVANLSVATSESWTDKESQEKKERTEWHRVTIFSELLIALTEKALHKGSRVYLEGALQTRKWQDKDGIDRYTTEIILRPFNGNMTLLDAHAKEHARPKAEPRGNRRNSSNQQRLVS